jgi:uncharacterized membrane protein (DUF106 family)
MSLHAIKQLKPFLSVLFIISTLFTLAFFHIEERRIGYSILKVRKDFKRLNEELKKKEVELARRTQPQVLDQIAQNQLSLKKTQSGQVIYLTVDQEDLIE